ncbi:MAG: lipase maturation factor family protein [Magnetovibrio sp.]|nr:lipase maturation factor family protein [Magnetovibrio sp.]
MGRTWSQIWDMPDDHQLVIALFLRGLALVYVIAFASIAVQIVGLSGAQGILPLVEHQHNLETHLGWQRFTAFPSVFWIWASDGALEAVAWLGCGFAVLCLLGFFQRTGFIVCYVFYLSLYHAASLFMNFQWDTLLLEAGFLSIFLTNGGSRLVVWLMRWLLFRLRFLSGISKLTSGDPAWSGLSAVVAYFQVQPLPHVGAWYAHQLPSVVLMIAAALVLIIEIAVPFLFLAPRRARQWGAALTIGLQLVIMATSNHNFINMLTILLCLFLFDDAALKSVLPHRWLRYIPFKPTLPGHIERSVFAGFAAVIITTSSAQVYWMVTDQKAKGWSQTLEQHVTRFCLSNRYHVFPTMKAERLEVVIEWSRDGRTWTPLDFKYKPGNPSNPPTLVMPHQPRLDWMMWFVPMGRPEFMMFYQRFVERILEGSEPVIDLLPTSVAKTFKTHGPPKYIRAQLVNYVFSTPTVRRETGRWWMTTWRQPFAPIPWAATSN